MTRAAYRRVYLHWRVSVQDGRAEGASSREQAWWLEPGLTSGIASMKQREN